jgi:hypothetical protein
MALLRPPRAELVDEELERPFGLSGTVTDRRTLSLVA